MADNAKKAIWLEANPKEACELLIKAYKAMGKEDEARKTEEEMKKNCI